MKRYTPYLIIFCLIFITSFVYGQGRNKIIAEKMFERRWHFDVMGGANLGGMAPLSFPSQIQEIKSYNPTLSGWFMGTFDYRFEDMWGVSSGLRFENKSMDTEAYVKGYSMELKQDGMSISGVWTGDVNTSVRTSHLSLPADIVFYPSSRWSVNMGGYVSFVFYRKFIGDVHDGYLRKDGPTGQKLEIKDPAPYNFSTNLRPFAYGLHIGGKWLAYRHFTVIADLNWGLSDVFKKDFHTVDFPMYAIYMNFGLGYRF